MCVLAAFSVLPDLTVVMNREVKTDVAFLKKKKTIELQGSNRFYFLMVYLSVVFFIQSWNSVLLNQFDLVLINLGTYCLKVSMNQEKDIFFCIVMYIRVKRTT